jgi:hypothetical protein
MTFENGDEFTGEFANGLREGKGIIKYENGDVYEGEWSKGL